MGLKIFDLSCEVFRSWKIKSEKLEEDMSQALGLLRSLLTILTNFNHQKYRSDLLVHFMLRVY